MPDITVPSKTALDAGTDQALAAMRDCRAQLAAGGQGESRWLTAADSIAAELRVQFPGVPAGRVLMSAVQQLMVLNAAACRCGHVPGADPDVLLTIAGLAALELDREEAGR